ncbi:T9SS type A sorting domain-containing protein [Chryseobacterium cucumeris]|uniref:T9SS C-terminal target domain-containing protein n=1 Tax=Chryseobacterium cucumeris TaxID=1813611 RepID=A0ABX9X8R0_9FLAO|nr:MULTISPECIES: T9SS type A sorting domain-containing protein [Chryseobacterium]KYH06168.1 secretion protein [Chryseobacterium cucumeris]QWT84674.1 T9SS type A sorting domain-containing protein [Chryseobacterium sp. PCH239]RKE78644.1 putative secreted protein (Por secretion system target) [Chryseobacterium sp. AG363]ROH92627.1 T9SS C-terminal target domain-containing protein [Chryseobacterium cucumeris]WFB66171.1 T9SS type A sorting domain-containing protein [Chryseobacterium sp. WX]
MERISIYCIILSVFSISILHAQAVVLAAGLDASAANGFVSYSVGQTTYLEKGTGQVLEGVQQPYEIITLTTFENSSELTGILLYPNPFRDYLYLDFTSNNFKGSEYQLFDAQGKLVKKDKISQSKSELNFSSIPSAMYIIRITQNGENIKTFKIIKK